MPAELADRLRALMDRSGLVEIEFEDGQTHVHLKKDGPAPPPAAEPLPAERPLEDHALVAGLTGTFYRASSPDAPPYIEVGDEVTEGQTIGLLEAMKVLNPLEADRSGRIVAIEAEDGALVMRGAVLFRIAREEAP